MSESDNCFSSSSILLDGTTSVALFSFSPGYRDVSTSVIQSSKQAMKRPNMNQEKAIQTSCNLNSSVVRS
uniref:Putative uncharacterized protein YOR186C-A n=1 Tax=Saccharomyces cerevisiae (strain ATCC 204508 / S288c) TaxID=559292 RepID=YO86A_YEAST|nr:RecName: Full=Putative uncharacterized protein YOR186C-A [Saccharomyces cerevisiae S288C]AAL79292.1 unknown [Saccharomyces cerevisiae]